MRSNNRTRLLAAVTVVAALALAACGSDDDASSATDEPTATAADAAATATDPAGTEVATTDAAPADTTTADTTADSAADAGAPVEAPETIHIAYQQVPNGDLIVKNQGWLEEAFGPDVNIEWSLFASGGDVNEAVIAGAVDIGLVGSSPASRGLSTGIEYTVPWIFDVIGAAESLVATPGHHDDRRPRGQDGRHTVRVDRPLQPPRRARRRRRGRVDRQHHRCRSRRHLRGVDPWRHRRRVRLEPEPGEAHRRGWQRAHHERRPGREGQDHLRPRHRVERLRRRVPRRRRTCGPRSRTARSS